MNQAFDASYLTVLVCSVSTTGSGQVRSILDGLRGLSGVSWLDAVTWWGSLEHAMSYCEHEHPRVPDLGLLSHLAKY